MTNNDIVAETILVLQRSADSYDSGDIGWCRYDIGMLEDGSPVDEENVDSPDVRCLCASGMLQRQANLMAKNGEISKEHNCFLDGVADMEFMFSVHTLFPDPFGQYGMHDDDDDMEAETIERWNDEFAQGSQDVISACRAATKRLRERQEEL